MAAAIKFGTSGWRAILADEFTYGNVRRAVTGIAKYVTSTKPNGARIIVGRDPRILGEQFTALAADLLASHGITPLLIGEAVPTPAISYEVIRTKADGAINFTASHNPPEYNGIKFSTSDGAPALPHVTKHIEDAMPPEDPTPDAPAPTLDPQSKSVQRIDPQQTYLARFAEIVDLAKIKKSGLKVVFDPMWGAARGYTDHLLREHGIPCATVHDFRDVLFGGHAPEPDEHLLQSAIQTMRETSSRLVIATDGDADRFGIVDDDGWFVQPNYVIALLFDYLVESRGWKNGVAKSVATTNLVNALATFHQVELHETPVGFKYIGELIDQDKIVIGGEESAGLSIRHHVPEKDGMIAGLLCCEMVASRGKNLRAQLHDLFGKVGSYYPVRENFRLTPELKAKFTSKLTSQPSDFFGRKVKEIVRTDGFKAVFDDGSWICYRLSGTEPVVRIYSESRSEDDLKKLSDAAKQWILQ